jgi:hypothetical protein
MSSTNHCSKLRYFEKCILFRLMSLRGLPRLLYALYDDVIANLDFPSIVLSLPCLLSPSTVPSGKLEFPSVSICVLLHDLDAPIRSFRVRRLSPNGLYRSPASICSSANTNEPKSRHVLRCYSWLYAWPSIERHGNQGHLAINTRSAYL